MTISPYQQGKQDYHKGISLTDARYVLPVPSGNIWPSDLAINEWQRGWRAEHAKEQSNG